MRFYKHKKCSALVVTILVLGVILTVAISIMAVSLKERRSSLGSSRSLISYEAADSGVEEVLNDLLKGGYSNLTNIPNCSASSHSIESSTFNYIVELRDNTGKKINCDSGDLVSSVKSIKSVGTSGGQSQRAVEAPVNAP